MTVKASELGKITKSQPVEKDLAFWCIVCREFKYNQSFRISLCLGGWICSHHQDEEVEHGKMPE